MRETPVRFRYSDGTGAWHDIVTLEESQYPQLYRRDGDATPERGSGSLERAGVLPPEALASTSDSVAAAPDERAEPTQAVEVEGHQDFVAGQRGVSYETLLLPYLRGASKITITDPYIRMPHPGRNLTDLLSLLAAAKDEADEIDVMLVTTEESRAETNHGWRLDLGKGLDIWQEPSDNPFDFGRNRQEFRLIGSAFTVHYVKIPVVDVEQDEGL